MPAFHSLFMKVTTLFYGQICRQRKWHIGHIPSHCLPNQESLWFFHKYTLSISTGNSVVMKFPSKVTGVTRTLYLWRVQMPCAYLDSNDGTQSRWHSNLLTKICKTIFVKLIYNTANRKKDLIRLVSLTKMAAAVEAPKEAEWGLLKSREESSREVGNVIRVVF